MDVKETIQIQIQRIPWRIEIGGSCKEADVVIAALQQALRFFEQQQMKAAIGEAALTRYNDGVHIPTEIMGKLRGER